MMEVAQAHRIMDAAAHAARATEELFKAIDARAEGELLDSDAVEVVEAYCAAKSQFENAVTTRGLI